MTSQGRNMERTVAVDSGVTVVARRGGVVDSVDASRIVVRVNDDETSAGEPGVDNTGEASGGEPGTLDINGIAVTNASLSYVDGATGDRIEITDLSFTTGSIVSDDSGAIAIDGMDLGGNIIGVVDVPVSLGVSLPSIALDPIAQSADIGRIEIGLMSVDLIADVEPFSYAGDPQPTANLTIAAFSPRTLMRELNLEAPETADPDVLERFQLDAAAEVRPDAIAMTDLRLVIDDTMFTGEMSAPRGPDGVYTVKLAGDSIDIARYMAPASDAGAAEAGAAETAEIPVDLIRAFDVRGDFSIDTVSLGDILFENVTLGVNSKDGQLRMHPIAADFFDGGYRGDVRINAASDTASISVNENINDVDLAAMARAMFGVENVTGMVNGSFQLAGRGADMNAIRRDLDGNMSFELVDGALEGTDVWYELRKARAYLKGEPEPEAPATPRTELSSMKGSGVVTNGVMRNDDLFAELPFMQMTGGGTVNFVEATVDYSVTGRFLEKPEFATDVTQGELDDFTKAVIPFRITGPLSSPSIGPDLEAMLRDRAEEEAKKILLDKLLGEDEKPEEGAATDGEEPEKEKDLEDQLKDEARKALKDLFGD